MAKVTRSDYWEQIFDKYDVVNKVEENRIFEISSTQINEFNEARLMAKFDFSKQLPKPLKDNNLSILPVSNGKYLLGHFNLYQQLPKDVSEEYEVLKLPSHMETIDPDNIYSEANALHIALLTGMLQDFVNDDLQQTISGRMRPNGFSFYVDLNSEENKFRIDVDRPQIEIDGGYEGEKYVVIVEAKNKQPEDFIIRQLYYPLRYWKGKVSKPIKTIFFTYDSGVYRLYDYSFKDLNDYNSLELIKQKSYVVQYPNTEETLTEIWNNCNGNLINDDELEIQFPQADSLTRIFEILHLCQDKCVSAKEAGECIEYSERQGKYYIDACIYLGLMKFVKKGSYGITDLGLTLIQSKPKMRNQLLAKLILSHEAFYYAFELFVYNKKLVSVNEAEEILRKYVNRINSDETYHRRSSTITGWLRWLINSNL